MNIKVVPLCLTVLTFFGCGAEGDQARLNSFAKSIRNTQTAYSKSSGFVVYALNKAGEMRNEQGEIQMIALLKKLDFNESLKNARGASSSLNGAEEDFRFIQSRFKGSSRIFKTDFFRLKEVMANHAAFIKSISEGEASGERVEKWLQENRESKDVFKRLIAETERLGGN